MDIKNISGKNNLYIDDARKSHAVSYNVDGVCEQQTYTGKNLFNDNVSNVIYNTTNNAITQINNGVRCTFTSTTSATYRYAVIPIPNSSSLLGKQCTLSANITVGGSSNKGAIKVYQTNANGSVKGNVVHSLTSTGNVTFTFPSSFTTDATTFSLIFYSNDNGTVAQNEYVDYTNIQLELGSTATDFEPYVGGTPSPNPNYPQDVETIPGIINLFNGVYKKYNYSSGLPYSETTNITINSSDSNNINFTLNANLYIYVLTDTIQLEPNTQYTISFTRTDTGGSGSNRNRNYVYSVDNSTYAAIAGTPKNVTGNVSITFTTTSTGKVAFAWGSNNSSNGQVIDIKNIQVEKGSVAHEYVPYGYYTRVKVTGKNLFDSVNPNVFNGYLASSSGNIVTNSYDKSIYIQCKPNTTYTVSKIASIRFRLGTFSSEPINGMSTSNKISNDTGTALTITSGASDTYLLVYCYNTGDTLTFQQILDSIQIEQNNEATTYEPYKEKKVLVDMSKENLFDKNNANIINGFATVNTPIITANDNFRTLYIPCKENTTYTVSKIASTRFSVSYTTDTPTVGMSVNGIMQNNTATFQPFTTGSGAKYLIVFFYNYASDTLSYDEVLNSIKIFESDNPTPYYELCKINTYKDTLSIDDQGNCIINKNIGKKILDGGESWSGGSFQSSYRYKITIDNATTPSASDLNIYSNYFHASSNVLDSNITTGEIAHYKSTKDFYFSASQTSTANFKTWLSTHNTEVYYILNTPEKITLKNTPLPLFNGINHITFVDSFETDTRLTYENDISPSDKQALIDGTATIQTEIEVHGENLFEPFNATFNNNITFTYSIDGYINCNGTTTATAYSMTSGQAGNYLISLPSGTYTISGGTSDISIHVVNSSGTVLANTSETATFTLSQTTNVFVRAAISSGKTLNNVKVYPILEEGTMPVLTETNSVIDWNHEDFRQVKDEGFIGQFVARQVTGNLHNLTDDFKITDKELIVKLGVRTNNNTNWYSLGNFLTTKVSDDEVGDKTSFEALDYTKKFNKEYEDRVTYPCTALELAKDVCDQCGVDLGNFDFKNNDYVIEGNVFTNNESCRDVMKAIGKLAFSWVRCDWDNKVYIDFDPTPFTTNQIPETCDTIGNNKYYNLKTQKEVYGPVDKVIIGYSAIEGEKTYIGSENGTCVINVLDNPLVYNQEQRAMVITAAYDLLGLTYTPLNTQTIGHPWLRADEPVKVNDMESVSHTTMPLDRTIQYFGHIKTLIDSTTETKTNDNLSYKPEMVKNYERSEIYNDQINKEIGIILEEQTDTNQRLNTTISTLDGTIQRVSRTETVVTDITTTTQVSTGKNQLYTDDAVEGNVLSYSADGATEQQTYTGKNLCGIPDQTFTHNNVTITIKNGEITLNGTANATGTKWIDPIKTTTINGNYVSNCIYISGTAPSTNPANFNVRKSDGTIIQGTQVNLISENKSVQFSVSEDTSIIYGIYVQNGTTYTNYKFKPQLVAGTTEDYNYEPYVGGTPSPNPDYPQDVETIPSIQNKFNYSYNDVQNVTRATKSEATNGFTVTSTGESGYGYASVPLDNSLLGKTVTISMKSTGNKTPSGRLFYLNTNGAVDGAIQVFWTTNNSLTTTLPSTLPSGKKGIALVLYISQGNNAEGDYATFTDIQVEEGTSANEYVSYGYYTKVKVTGKNILNPKNSLNGTFSVDSTTETLNNDGGAITSGWIQCKPNTSYTLSGGYNRQRWQTKSSDGTITYMGQDSTTITTNSTASYIRCYYYYASSSTDPTTITDVQLEEGETSTTYEPYKENQVLIDMSKENLFDSANATILNAYIDNTEVGTSTKAKTTYIKCSPNTTYTVCKDNSGNNNRFGLATTENEPTIGTSTMQYISDHNKSYLSITTNGTANYLLIQFYHTDETAITQQEVLDSIKIYQSNNPTPYYELCKIGDYKDTLSIDSSGNCVINKNVGKIILNGSESYWYSWDSASSGTTRLFGTDDFNSINHIGIGDLYSNYFLGSDVTIWNVDEELMTFNTTGNQRLRFRLNRTIADDASSLRAWLSTHNTEVYYIQETPEIITLNNTKIPLFQGINHIYLVDDLETDTSISFYRQTPLTGTYATVTQLNEVSTEKTTEITQVRKDMLVDLNSERLRIDSISQTINEDGVPILNTGTGYVFDSDGLKIEKTNQDVKSQLDNDGLSVIYNDNDVLTARSDGVNAVNMTVNKFYVQKPIRMEKTKSISDNTSVGLGFFYVGE